MAQLRYSPLSGHFRSSLLPPSNYNRRLNHIIINYNYNNTNNNISNAPPTITTTSQSPSILQLFYSSKSQIAFASSAGSGDGGSGGIGGSGGWSGGGGDSYPSSSGDGDGNDNGGFGPIGAFMSGWRSRVEADPQFPFKVMMEELVGVSACVLGDMASRPNFGLNELDFVFSTLVVGSILNFVLMYLLAPTAASAGTTSMPSIFSGCPPSHMFEPGSYGLLSRMGTFVYKGTLFAAVGFAAGLVGTAISNGLINLRKKMDPNFETPNKPPPTVLNALTWAIHMGLSSNFRYQTLNGIEFLLEKGLSSYLFKTSVVALRCLNNVLGGMSFVVLARLTGAQSAAEQQEKEQVKEAVVPVPAADKHTDGAEVVGGIYLQNNTTTTHTNEPASSK